MQGTARITEWFTKFDSFVLSHVVILLIATWQECYGWFLVYVSRGLSIGRRLPTDLKDLIQMCTSDTGITRFSLTAL